MVYKIADFYIEIDTGFPENERIFAPYLAREKRGPDFTITVSDTEIDEEYEIFVRENGNLKCLRSYLARNVVLRKISSEILSRGAFLIHGALIAYKGRGYLFSAKSGTGKTTHIRLWQKLFGEENVTIVNGDKPFLRIDGDEIYGYGTPWCGKERYNVNMRVPLDGVCFIERAEENQIQKISEFDAVQRLFSQVEIKSSANLEAQLELLDALVTRVDMYKLSCNMELEAAKVAYEGMKKDR
ncbi:MAG: hypothetical protein IJC81_01170 [Clostridia bacterium]|nr:hypothetical protein [Clostridia bacterium]